MRVLVLDSSLPEIEALLESRRISGRDRSDEMWDGVLHLSPHPNVRHVLLLQQLAEILGPLANDESWEKLPFYAAHGVDEVLILEPERQEVSWLRLQDGAYVETEQSSLIELGAAQLAASLDWD